MQDIGYENRNAFLSYGTLTLLIYIYFIKMFISLSMAIYEQYKPIYKKHKMYQYVFMSVKRGVYFNYILRLSLEAYFEFYIGGVLNFQSAQWNTNGEVLGILLAFFCLANVLFNLPLLSLYIFTRKLKKLNNSKFKRVCGDMYENTKYDSKLCLAYTFLFILRRFLFISYGLFIVDPAKGGL
jgi:hypothetical protein